MNFGLNSETIEYRVGLMDNNKRLDFYEVANTKFNHDAINLFKEEKSIHG
jgi:hypothetical protein